MTEPTPLVFDLPKEEDLYAAAVPEDKRVIKFQIKGDERVLTATAPSDSALNQLLASFSRRTGPGENLWGLFNFLDHVFDDADAHHLARRLEDDDDKDFGASAAMQLVNNLLDQWMPQNRAGRRGRRGRA